MKLPQFWSAPLAKALEEPEYAAEGAPKTWLLTLERAPEAASCAAWRERPAPRGSAGASSPWPKEKEE